MLHRLDLAELHLVAQSGKVGKLSSNPATQWNGAWSNPNLAPWVE